MPKKTDDKVIEKTQSKILKLAGRAKGVTPVEIQALPGSAYMKDLALADLKSKKKQQLEARRCDPKDARKVSFHVPKQKAAAQAAA